MLPEFKSHRTTVARKTNNGPSMILCKHYSSGPDLDVTLKIRFADEQEGREAAKKIANLVFGGFVDED